MYIYHYSFWFWFQWITFSSSLRMVFNVFIHALQSMNLRTLSAISYSMTKHVLYAQPLLASMFKLRWIVRTVATRYTFIMFWLIHVHLDWELNLSAFNCQWLVGIQPSKPQKNFHKILSKLKFHHWMRWNIPIRLVIGSATGIIWI